MHANMRKAQATSSGELVMVLEPSPYPHLKVVRLPDVKDVPAAIGDWTEEPVETREWVELSSGRVNLKVVPSSV